MNTPKSTELKRVNLFVPFEEKSEASKLGARWDKDAKIWYVPAGVESKPFSQWLQPKVPTVADLQTQFCDAMLEAGLVVPDTLELDGKWHKAKVIGSSNPRAFPGSYKGDLTGDRPNGYIINNLTGYKKPWSAKGLVLTEEQRSALQQQSIEQQRSRDAELAAERAAVASACTARFSKMPDPDPNHPYLARKGVQAFGLKEEGGRLVVPLRDVEGEIWNLQHIQAEAGAPKVYEKGGQKAGRMHVIGDLDRAEFVICLEGYATAASMHLATGLTSVVGFDSSNLSAVVKSIWERHPGIGIMIGGDDDVLTVERIHHHIQRREMEGLGNEGITLAEAARVGYEPVRLASNPACVIDCKFVDGPEAGLPRLSGIIRNEETNKEVQVLLVNAGREKAQEAGRLHGCPVVFPRFQTMEGRPTDFNDLHLREGLPAVREQVMEAMRGIGFDVTTEAVVARQFDAGTVAADAQANKRYVGKVVGNSMHHAVQDVGRGDAVKHDLASLDRAPVVGQKVRIIYSEERGRVEAVAPRSRGAER